MRCRRRQLKSVMRSHSAALPRRVSQTLLDARITCHSRHVPLVFVPTISCDMLLGLPNGLLQRLDDISVLPTPFNRRFGLRIISTA